MKAFDQNPNTDWATRGQGQNSWINIKFAGNFKITKFVYTNRAPNEANKKVVLTFQPANVRETVELEIGTTEKVFSNEIIASSVKVYVTSTYSTFNNGAEEITFYGTKHEDDEPSKNK